MPAEAVIRIAREFAKSALDSGYRSMMIFGAGICQWYADTIPRYPRPAEPDRLPGS